MFVLGCVDVCVSALVCGSFCVCVFPFEVGVCRSFCLGLSFCDCVSMCLSIFCVITDGWIGGYVSVY